MNDAERAKQRWSDLSLSGRLRAVDPGINERKDELELLRALQKTATGALLKKTEEVIERKRDELKALRRGKRPSEEELERVYCLWATEYDEKRRNRLRFFHDHQKWRREFRSLLEAWTERHYKQ